MSFEPYKEDSELAARICQELRVRKSTHPLDGGTHVSRSIDCSSEEELIVRLRQANISALYQVVKINVLDVATHQQVTRYVVRIVE